MFTNSSFFLAAFPALAQLKQDPFFDVLLKANVLQQPIFTFTLRQNQPSLFLGGIPSGLAEPVYVDIDSSQGFWGTQGSVNGNQTNGIQDTGTTLIVAPTSFAQTLFTSLNLQTFTQDGSTYATYDASNPPKITLQFGTFSQDLSPETLSFGQTNDGKPVLSIIGSDVGIDSVIFGDSFLRNVTIVFSRAEKVSESNKVKARGSIADLLLFRSATNRIHSSNSINRGKTTSYSSSSSC